MPRTAQDLLDMPGCIDILINGCVQTGRIQIRLVRPVCLLRQGQSLLVSSS